MNKLNRIKELRQKNNLTLKQLGQKLNMLDSTLSQYENEKRKPKKEETWQKIADYFEVSVPYLKGLTLDAKQLAKRLIPEIHQSYFDTWCLLNKPRKNVTYHDYSPEFVNNVNVYITLNNDNSKLPVELYSDNEIEYKLSNKVYKYWEVNFSSIFDEISSKEVSSNTNNFFLFDEFKKILKKRKDKLAQNSKSLTALGFFYKAEFDNEVFSENRMHDNMRIMLMHGKLENAKKAINKYFEVITKLKNEVNNFNPDDYFMYRLDNIVLPTQNPFNANLIMNEIYKRVHNGDMDLLHFIMENDGLSLIKVYYNYKKAKNEDTKYLSKLQEKYKQRLKFLSDDNFRSYLSTHYDFSTPNKIYDIEKIYKKYQQDRKH